MTVLLATVADVKTRLSGDVPTMSSAFDGDIAGAIEAVSAEIQREVGKERGFAPGSGWSFLAASLYAVQQIIISSGQTSPTGGTFALSFGGQTATGIVYNAAASAVQSALQGLTSIGTGNCTVTGPNGGPYTVTFAGARTGPQALISGDGTGLTPAAAITVVTMVPGIASESVVRTYKGRPGGVAILYIDDCVSVSAVGFYEPPGTLRQTLVVGTDVLVVPYQGLPINALELTNAGWGFGWPVNPGGIRVTLRPGFALEIPEDAREACIVETARAYLGARAGYNDAIGITPWGSLVTSKAFTDKTWRTIRGYRLFGSGMR